MRLLAAATLALCLAAAMPAGAESIALNYELVVHATEVQSMDVPGRPKQRVGIAAFRGLSMFEDGRVAAHQYSGHFDFDDGAGRFAGYALWLFEDGSRLMTEYEGAAEPSQGGGITFTGKHTRVHGSGRYEGVSGTGEFTGRRVDLLDEGGDTYQQGSLTLQLAKP